MIVLNGLSKFVDSVKNANYIKVGSSSIRADCLAAGVALITGVSLFAVVSKCGKKKTTAQVFSHEAENRSPCIFITGGASGIGLATACKFMKEGWKVGIYDRNVENLKEKILAKEPSLKETLSSRLTFKKTELLEDSQCSAAIKDFSSFTGGKMDVLFNNAGLFFAGKFDEVNELQKQKTMIRVNCEATVQMTYLALPLLKNTNNSCILSMASLAAIGGMANVAVYSSTKIFVWSLTNAWRSEFTRAYGIRVGDISVGFVDTPLVQDMDSSKISTTHQKGIGKVQDTIVAETVFKAAHESSLWNVHFYVNFSEKILKRGSLFLEGICPKAYHSFWDGMNQVASQKSRQNIDAEIVSK